LGFLGFTNLLLLAVHSLLCGFDLSARFGPEPFGFGNRRIGACKERIGIPGGGGRRHRAVYKPTMPGRV
jgi:hypothetical protein